MISKTTLAESLNSTFEQGDNDSIFIQEAVTFDELLHIRSEWDAFMEALGAEIYLTFDWCKTWWKYYGTGRHLRIFLFWKKGRLCGILPIFWEAIGFKPFKLVVAKIVGSDFIPVTFSVPIEEGVLDCVLNSFIHKLNEKCSWDILYLGDICGKYKSHDRLVSTLDTNFGSQYTIQLMSTEVQTYFRIENEWEKQISSTLNQKQRNKTRREFKEIKKRNLTLSAIQADSENVITFFENFVQMHQIHWQQKGMPGHFTDWPHSYDFHKEIAEIQLEQNRLRLLQIRLDDEIIGYEYLFKFGNGYQWYLGSRSGLENERHLHFYRLSFKIKHESAIKDKIKYIDAGRGRYAYKIEIGGELFPIHRIFMYKKNLLHSMKVGLFRLFIRFLNLFYINIWRNRILYRLKIKKPFWSWLIRAYMLAR